jgi:hypothetical protein
MYPLKNSSARSRIQDCVAISLAWRCGSPDVRRVSIKLPAVVHQCSVTFTIDAPRRSPRRCVLFRVRSGQPMFNNRERSIFFFFRRRISDGHKEERDSSEDGRLFLNTCPVWSPFSVVGPKIGYSFNPPKKVLDKFHFVLDKFQTSFKLIFFVKLCARRKLR